MSTPSKDLLQRLGGQLARGEAILFTGAGFSVGASTRNGKPLPGVRGLKELLWPIAFPATEFDDSSSLGDIFDCAVRQSAVRVTDVFNTSFRVDSESLPTSYRTWFAAPWRSIYTLNIDDMELAVQRKFELPVRITPLSALSAASVPNSSTDLSCIHLNGALEDVPNVTFSPPQYGERLPGRDAWYPTLVADLVGHPIVFVGTSLDESPLWQHMALRGDRSHLERELRPRSYLVSPSLPKARAALLRSFNIDLIEMTHGEFAEEVLGRLLPDIETGHRVLAEQRSRRTRPTSLSRVSDLRNVPLPESIRLADYLMGREPMWKDVTDGYAVVREFESSVLGENALLEPRITLFTGTAGTGKTTTLMRLALELQARGEDAWWLELDTDLSLARLRREVREVAPSVLAIDDIDSLGSSALPFITELRSDLPSMRILLASRSTRAERLSLTDEVARMDAQLVSVPPLGDEDIDNLLSALDRANRLGQLKGLGLEERRKALREHCNRQLLVAMIEATSGRRFDEKVEDECRELSAEQSLIYSICALATRFKGFLRREEVLLAVGGSPAEALRDFDALRRQHLIIERVADGFSVRHRVIAERACAFFRAERRLAPAVGGLLFALATKVGPRTSRNARELRLLVRLLNHRFILEELGDLSAARQVYSAVEHVLSNDFHFWLQRGGLEVQVGDLDLAENYLNQALGLAPEDHLVQTEWAFMSLKKAADDAAAGRSGWRERADDAIAYLKDAIDDRGRRDHYPYHVLGSQGLRLSRRAPITDEDNAVLLRDLYRIVADGARLHPSEDTLAQLRDDLQRAYLMLSLPPAQRTILPES